MYFYVFWVANYESAISFSKFKIADTIWWTTPKILQYQIIKNTIVF